MSTGGEYYGGCRTKLEVCGRFSSLPPTNQPSAYYWQVDRAHPKDKVRNVRGNRKEGVVGLANVYGQIGSESPKNE